MKKIKILALILAVVMLYSCNDSKERKTVSGKAKENLPQKEQTLEMNKDTLNSKILDDVEKELSERRLKIETEALTVVAQTQSLLQSIESGKSNEAIETGHKLIGKLEVLLTKDPSLSLIPIDADYRQEEVVTDIETVRDIVRLAEKAMDDKYYQVARNLLDGLKSEIVINSYYIPTATYPDAIKVAVALLEDGKTEEAKIILQQVLGTIVIEKTVLPLPVLKAEQMVIEAASIDAENHENSDKVINLLKNAKYQLHLAEELGYGKKDKEYKTLYDSITTLEKSVERKGDSQDAFDSLKSGIKKFKERLFPIGK